VQILVPITLITWIPLCLILFAMLPRRQAVLIGIIGAWLFLPPSGIAIAGLPDYTKSSAFSYGILLGTLIFMPDRILQFRPHWIDIPLFCFSFCPMASSLANGLGPYDGAASMLGNFDIWVLPYLVGRLHFNDERSLRDLLVGIVVGGLVYVPFCLWEMRMSPMILNNVYGFGKFMGMRMGGWRPRVFFLDGLELGVWMSICSLSAIWLWRRRALTTLWGYPFGSFFVPILLVVTVLCRSSGALVLFAAVLTALWGSIRFNTRLLLFSLLVTPILYAVIRIPNAVDYSGGITLIQTYFDPDRAQSLEFRLQNEDMLIAHAMRQPVFGWGGWGRSRIIDASGKDLSVTDGLWVIYLGQLGVVGLCGFLSFFLCAPLVFLKRYRPRKWIEYGLVAQPAAVGIMAIYAIDSLLNAFINSIALVALGGLASCLQAGPASFAAFTKRAMRRDEGVDADDDRQGVLIERGVELSDRYIEMARNYRNTGSYRDAGSAWRHAYELLVDQCTLTPDDKTAGRRLTDCANDLAWFLLSRPNPEPGDRAEAVRLARHASQADPRNANYLNTLAAACCRAGEDEAAILAVDHILALEAMLAGLDFAVLALAHARQGRAEQAAQWLEEARAWRARSQARNATLDELIEEAEAVVVS